MFFYCLLAWITFLCNPVPDLVNNRRVVSQQYLEELKPRCILNLNNLKNYPYHPLMSEITLIEELIIMFKC